MPFAANSWEIKPQTLATLDRNISNTCMINQSWWNCQAMLYRKWRKIDRLLQLWLHQTCHDFHEGFLCHSVFFCHSAPWRSGTLTLWHINIGEMVFHLRFHKELYLAVDGSDGNKAVQIRWHTALKLVCVHLKVSMTKYFNKFAGTHEHLRSRVARSFRSAELKAAWVRRNGRGRGEPRQHNSLCWNHPKNCDSLQHFLEVFFLFLYGEGAWFHALFGKSR